MSASDFILVAPAIGGVILGLVDLPVRRLLGHSLLADMVFLVSSLAALVGSVALLDSGGAGQILRAAFALAF